MKVIDLIHELNKYPSDMEVCIGDYKKNAYHSDGEATGCSEGIYPKFSVDKMTVRDIPVGSQEWISLTFDSNYGE